MPIKVVLPRCYLLLPVASVSVLEFLIRFLSFWLHQITAPSKCICTKGSNDPVGANTRTLLRNRSGRGLHGEPRNAEVPWPLVLGIAQAASDFAVCRNLKPVEHGRHNSRKTQKPVEHGRRIVALNIPGRLNNASCSGRSVKNNLRYSLQTAALY